MDWQLLKSDQELFERELESFVPPRIFDAHVHLYEFSQFDGTPPTACLKGPESVGLDAYRQRIAEILPRRQVSALFFPFPHPKVNFNSANDFLIQQAKRDPVSRGQMLIRPEMDAEFVREKVRQDGFVGLKCYHYYSSERPTFDAHIPTFLAEEHVRIAHEEGLTITLHMVRSRAMADPSNQEVIRRYAEKYPKARFILAHAARGFNPYHTVLGIGALEGLRNIWCDTSAVTEAGAFEAIVRTLGSDRLVYGSDFPVSHLRGRCVGIGDSFLWLSSQNTDFKTNYAEVQPALVGIESLRALKLACLNLRASDAQVEAFFYGNAAELYGLPR